MSQQDGYNVRRRNTDGSYQQVQGRQDGDDYHQREETTDFVFYHELCELIDFFNQDVFTFRLLLHDNNVVEEDLVCQDVKSE